MLKPRRPWLRDRPRLRGLSFNRLLPNIVTMLALCAGLTGIRYGLDGRWEAAVGAVIIAGVLDALDGRIARLLSGSTKFGAEFDSLSDFVSFGVAPSLILYFWAMNGAGNFGWALVLLFSVCCALRLARFNTMMDDPDPPPHAAYFFVGVPAPAAAGLVLAPMIISFVELPASIQRVVASVPFVSVFLFGVALLMVSRIPTFSMKRVRVPKPLVLPVMIVIGIIMVSLVTVFWATMSLLLAIYLASIPFAVVSEHRMRARHTALHPGNDSPPPGTT